MAPIKKSVGVALGQSAIPLGTLTYTKEGHREHSTFAYDSDWLNNAKARFVISPDLPLVAGNQFRKAPSKEDSIFHFAFADTEPDGWGCRVIARDHAKRRRAAQANGSQVPAVELSEIDYLLGVDDISRIGAIRMLDLDSGAFLRTIEDDKRGTPPLLELAQLLAASRAVELNKETAADLRYLRGKGTSVGGMRPKCTVVDDDGHLAIGKFPSVKDDRCVTRGEVLALHLAAKAGISVAVSRVVMSDDIPVALIRRFDRVHGARIPYLSAGSMMQASRQDDYAYTQIADTIVANSVDPRRDLEELWRRLAFNLLITNVDDHVQNHGFLHVEHGQWRLAPAFDINPFPDKDQELKLWLDESYGPVDSIEAVVQAAGYFRLDASGVQRVLGKVHKAIKTWKSVAKLAAVGMSERDIEDFGPAFENEQMRIARKLLK
ncbi:MAG: type II toxin-antitoxin system HipA family toxin [Burkholderiales bacterium]